MQDKKKKPTDREVGEMGRPSMARKFEEAMQEEFNSRGKKGPISKADMKRIIEVARKRRDIKAEMGGKDMSEAFEDAMQKQYKSRPKN